MSDSYSIRSSAATLPMNVVSLALRNAGPLLVLLMSLLFLAFFWGREINHDVAWYLVATREWLGGARLYVDVYEVNPPLNFYYTAPAILLADLTGVSDTNAQYILSSLLISVSLMAVWAILERHTDLSRPRRLFFLAGLGSAMILPALQDVGQREQSLVILTMPWLVAQLPGGKPISGRIRLLLAVVAAGGICLKPFFLLLPIAVTLWQCCAGSSMRPVLSLENLAMTCVGVAYVSGVWFLHPEYFRDVIPAASRVYGSIALPENTVRQKLIFNLSHFLPFLLLFLTGRSVPAGTGIPVAAACAGIGSYVLQWNGFSYHLIPFLSFAGAACCWTLARQTQLTPIAAAALFAVTAQTTFQVLDGPYANPVQKNITARVDPAWQADGVTVLSTNVHAGPPVAVALDTRWVGRFAHAWLIPGALNQIQELGCGEGNAKCDELQSILDRSRRDMIADIREGKPDLLVFDKRYIYIREPSFGWYAFFGKQPDWSAIIADYRRVSSDGKFDVWLRCTQATGARATACAAAS